MSFFFFFIVQDSKEEFFHRFEWTWNIRYSTVICQKSCFSPPRKSWAEHWEADEVLSVGSTHRARMGLCVDPLGRAVFSTVTRPCVEAYDLQQAAVYKTKRSPRTTARQPQHGLTFAVKFPLHFPPNRRLRFHIFPTITRASFCVLKVSSSPPADNRMGWTLETTFLSFPLSGSGHLHLPLHAHLLQMTLCHPSAVHWVRTVHTGGWAQPGPGLSSTSNDLQEPQRCVNVHSLTPSENRGPVCRRRSGLEVLLVPEGGDSMRCSNTIESWFVSGG